MKDWRRHPIFLIIIWLSATVLPAQQTAEFEFTRSLSYFKVRVIDSSNNPVAGLDATDFHVSSDRNTHEIAYFREIRDTPISIAVLLDVGPSMGDSEILRGKRLIFDLIHRLGVEDRIQVAVYDREVCFLSTLTSDRFELLEALTDISPGMACEGRESRWGVEAGDAEIPIGGSEVPRGREAGGAPDTATAGQAAVRLAFRTGQSLSGYAITEALSYLRKATDNQRIVLTISAGLPNVGEATLQDLRITEANLFTIDAGSTAEDLLSLGVTGSSRRRLVRGSGGFLFALETVLDRVEELRSLLKNYYLLGLLDDPDDRFDADALQFQTRSSGYQVTATPVGSPQN